MAYVDGLLADGERIVRRAHQHWFVLVWDVTLGGLRRSSWPLIAGIIRLLNIDDSGILMDHPRLGRRLFSSSSASRRCAWGWLQLPEPRSS